MSNLEEALKLKNLGNDEFKAKNFEKAVEYFSKAIALAPDDHILYSNRSGAFAEMGDYESALEDATKCVNLKPDWSKGYQRKGLAEFYLKRYKESIDTYGDGLDIDPENQVLKDGLHRVNQEIEKQKKMDPQALLQKLQDNPITKDYLNDNDFKQKMQMIQSNPALLLQYLDDPKVSQAIEVMFGISPDILKGAGMPGQQQQKQHSPEKQQHYDKNPPKTEQQSFEKGQFHKEQKKQQNIPTVNQDEEAKNQGNNLYKQKKFEEALIKYDEAIKFNPNEVLYYNNKAACYVEMKKFDEAIASVDKALEVAAEQKLNDYVKIAKLYARKSNIYSQMNNFEKAIEFINKALLEDNNAQYRQNLKDIQKKKQEKEALEYVNPEIAETHNNNAREFFLQGKYPEAMKEYDEAIKRNPNEAKFYSNKASCLQKLMEFPSALIAINKCLELDPKFIKGYAKKGNIHFGLKEYEFLFVFQKSIKRYHKAMDVFKEGLKLDPENEECKEGIKKVEMKIYYGNETKEEAEERARHGMADPEIQAILSDPQIQIALKDMQENPQNLMQHLQNPKIANAIQKLMMAGIIKTK